MFCTLVLSVFVTPSQLQAQYAHSSSDYYDSLSCSGCRAGNDAYESTSRDSIMRYQDEWFLDYQRRLAYRRAIEHYNRAIAEQFFRARQADMLRQRELAVLQYYDQSIESEASGNSGNSCCQAMGCCHNNLPNDRGFQNSGSSSLELIDPFGNRMNAADRPHQLNTIPQQRPMPSGGAGTSQPKENPLPLMNLPPAATLSNPALDSLPKMELPKEMTQSDSAPSARGHDHARHDHSGHSH